MKRFYVCQKIRLHNEFETFFQLTFKWTNLAGKNEEEMEDFFNPN